MSRPWQLVEAVEHGAGRIELRQRGERDYLITLDGRVLMNSAAHRSERALGALAVEALATRSKPRVLIAGLGMAFTLRGALDGLPRELPLVPVCAAGMPAVVARSILQRDGRENLQVVDEEGTPAWIERGYPSETAEE